MTESLDSARNWSAVAGAWDTHVDYVDEHAAGATERLLEHVDIRPGDRVLELACGPGTLGARLSELAGPDGAVVLSDIAPGMVEVARRRNAALANVECAVLEASAIDRPDHSFDVVVSRMGLMFTLEPAAAFAEIYRVLSPGGRLGALTWGALQDNPWMTCVGMAAMMNGLVAGGPPIGPGGIFSLSDPTEVESLAKGAGFTDVAAQAIPTTFHPENIDLHVERVSSLAGPLAQAFAAASADQIAAVKQSAAQLAANYVTEDGLALPGSSLLVTGRV